MAEATNDTTSQMVAKVPSTSKMVKIRALQPIAVKRGQDLVNIGPGQIVDVTEDEAKEFVDRVFVGQFGQSGEMSDNVAEASRHKVRRAERVS